MKVALIQPNNPYLIDDKVFPNIGLLRVGTQLQKEGHDVEVLDFNGKAPDGIKDRAHDFDAYGFSATTPQMPYVMKLFNILKKENPNARTIIGGAHPSAMYNIKQKGQLDINIQDLEVFDTIFAGEGENTKNIFRDGWQYGGIVKNIDDVEIPNRDLIDIQSYKYLLNGELTTSIQTQRGCPHQCTFCSGRDIEMYNKVRTHSPERVVKELDELNAKYGFKSFMWYDDEINLDIGRLEKLCSLLSERDYQHRGFIRNDAIVKHPESVKWLKEAGFVKLCAGVESGSDEMLKAIKKGTTYEINMEARRLVKEQGIHYEAFLLMGHPKETMKDIELTRKWLLEAKPDDFDLNLITPLPGSKMYDDAIPTTEFGKLMWNFNGVFFEKPRFAEEDSYYKGKGMQGKSTIRTKEISNKDYYEMRDVIDNEVRLKK